MCKKYTLDQLSLPMDLQEDIPQSHLSASSMMLLIASSPLFTAALKLCPVTVIHLKGISYILQPFRPLHFILGQVDHFVIPVLLAVELHGLRVRITIANGLVVLRTDFRVHHIVDELLSQLLIFGVFGNRIVIGEDGAAFLRNHISDILILLRYKGSVT
ncbi:hypothetical protein D3C81_1691800 [compost metagenome]